MKTVRIDEDECIGCGTCVELCPEIFAFNDDTNRAYVTLPQAGAAGSITDAADH